MKHKEREDKIKMSPDIVIERNFFFSWIFARLDFHENWFRRIILPN